MPDLIEFPRPGAEGLRLDPSIGRGPEGEITGDNGFVRISLLDAESYDGRVFKRRAIKGVGGGSPRSVCWLVAELDGVRIYVDGGQIIMTTRDLYP